MSNTFGFWDGHDYDDGSEPWPPPKPPPTCTCGSGKTSHPNLHVSWCDLNPDAPPPHDNSKPRLF